MNLLACAPLPYLHLAQVLLALALIGLGWMQGSHHVQRQWDAASAKQLMQASGVRRQQAEAAVQVVTRYVDRVNVVRQAGVAITNEVPVYVSPEADAACVLSRGFVRLHDAAVAGIVPGAAGGPDAAPAGIALSTVAGTVAANYERCHENTEQLIALQEWVREMKLAAEAGGQ